MQDAQITLKAQDSIFRAIIFGAFNHKTSIKDDGQQRKDKGRDQVRLKTNRFLLGVW